MNLMPVNLALAIVVGSRFGDFGRGYTGALVSAE
jgi:hypothetical protein